MIIMKGAVPPDVVGLLLSFAEQTMESRPPDFLVGPPNAPYLERWMTRPKNETGNCYVHRFLLDDEQRAEHDHPADNVTLVLAVGYREYSGGVLSEPRTPGDLVFRAADEPHRVVLINGRKPTSLWFHGLRVNEPWGFYCPQGKRPWFDFLGRDPNGTSGGAQDTGPGCG